MRPLARHRASVARCAVHVTLALAAAAALACAPGAPERRYDLSGTVVSVDRDAAQVTLAHEEIPGYMAAMTMPFRVKDRWAFDAMAPGDRVNATLVVSADRSWLEGISVSKPPVPTGAAAPSTAGAPSEPEPGSTPPAVPLENQDLQKVSIDRFRGKAVLVTFVYTRCPLPDQCPLMTTNFRKVEDALKADPELYGRTRLLTVSIDPAYDTARVMREYGELYAGSAAAFAHWDFVTGSPENVRQFANYFGLLYRTDEGQIVHSLRTAVIGPDGTLFTLYRGNDWTPDQAVRDLAAAAANAPH